MGCVELIDVRVDADLCCCPDRCVHHCILHPEVVSICGVLRTEDVERGFSVTYAEEISENLQ
jgi:hypothetical protein